MQKERLEFLKRYMGTISPTGFEEEASSVWRKEAESGGRRRRGSPSGRGSTCTGTASPW